MTLQDTAIKIRTTDENITSQYPGKERKKTSHTVIILKSKLQHLRPTLQLHGVALAVMDGLHMLVVDDGSALEGEPVELDALADAREADGFGVSDH